MQKILLLTTNQKRADKYKEKFKKYNLNIDFEILKEETPELQGESVSKVARYSALWAAKKYKVPCIKEDAAFEIPSLNNFPSIYVKYMNIMIGAQGYIDLMKNKVDRRACWHNVLCYSTPKGQTQIFESITWGEIGKEASNLSVPGPNWNADKVWIPKGYNCPIVEIPKEERKKNVWKHNKFKKFIDWYIKQESAN